MAASTQRAARPAPPLRLPEAPSPRRRSARSRGPRRSLRFRVRRILVLAVLLLIADTCLSIGQVIVAPSNSPLGVRLVEWLRDNGAAWLVSDVERFYYGISAPSTGGAALRALPKVGAAGPSTYTPPAVAPAINPPLPGEGVWHGTGPLVRGAPAVR